MTIQEIRDLIAKKIAGQGTMVDVGNGLPAILNGILDEIAAIPAPPETVIFDLTDFPKSSEIALPESRLRPICNAFKAGKIVLLKVNSDTGVIFSQVLNGPDVYYKSPITFSDRQNMVSILED